MALVLPPCLGSANMNYKIAVAGRAMPGKAALLCASAQLQCLNAGGAVEDLLPSQESLTEIFLGGKTCSQTGFCLHISSWELGGDKGGGNEKVKWDAPM